MTLTLRVDSWSTEAEDIVKIRHRVTTGEDKAYWRDLMCVEVTVVFRVCNSERLSCVQSIRSSIQTPCIVTLTIHCIILPDGYIRSEQMRVGRDGVKYRRTKRPLKNLYFILHFVKWKQVPRLFVTWTLLGSNLLWNNVNKNILRVMTPVIVVVTASGNFVLLRQIFNAERRNISSRWVAFALAPVLCGGAEEETCGVTIN
jgi:hypothetical protein